MSRINFPFWRDDKLSICSAIERRKASLKIVLKTKNESHFLDEWIAYHAEIVGIENIIIADNMSTDRIVIEKYKEYAKQLILFQFDGFHNFLHIVEAFPELYRSLAGSCDHVIFLDTDEFVTIFDKNSYTGGASVSDFIRDFGRHKIIPGTWLENCYKSKKNFYCGVDYNKLQWGLRWGKPVIRANADIKGIILHNTQVFAALMSPSTPLNIFILHMKNLYPEQRIKINISKLANRGFCAENDSIADILSKDLSGVSDGSIKIYVDELRRLESDFSVIDYSFKEGSIETGSNGLLNFYSSNEAQLLSRHLSEDGQRYLAECAELERDGASGGAPARPQTE